MNWWKWSTCWLLQNSKHFYYFSFLFLFILLSGHSPIFFFFLLSLFSHYTHSFSFMLLVSSNLMGMSAKKDLLTNPIHTHVGISSETMEMENFQFHPPIKSEHYSHLTVSLLHMNNSYFVTFLPYYLCFTLLSFDLLCIILYFPSFIVWELCYFHFLTIVSIKLNQLFHAFFLTLSLTLSLDILPPLFIIYLLLFISHIFLPELFYPVSVEMVKLNPHIINSHCRKSFSIPFQKHPIAFYIQSCLHFW